MLKPGAFLGTEAHPTPQWRGGVPTHAGAPAAPAWHHLGGSTARQRLTAHQDSDLPDLKLLVLAGEPVPESMHRKWVVPEDDFWAGVGAPGDGLRVVNGYGVTECSVYQFRHEWSRRPGEVGLDRDCAGMPFDGVDVALGASLPLSGSACLPLNASALN